MIDLKEEALAGILETLQKGLDQAPDYVSDLVHRYGTFVAWSNGVGAFICLVVICLGIRRMIKLAKGDIDIDWFGPIILVLIIGLFPFIFCTIGMIKGILVPEIVILSALK